MFIPVGTFFLVGRQQEGTDKVFTYAVTADHDDWSTVPRADQATEILEGHAEIMKGLN